MNRRLAITALAFLSLLCLTNPLTHIMGGDRSGDPASIAMRGFATPLLMAAIIGAVAALVRILRGRADGPAVVAATLVVMGWTAGVRILELRQLDALARYGVDGVPADAIDLLMRGSRIVWASIVPLGILFPIGSVLFGVTILAVAPVPRWIGALLVAVGIFFPIGRIGGFTWALNTADLVMAASFGTLAWQLASKRHLWTGEPAADASLAAPELAHGA